MSMRPAGARAVRAGRCGPRPPVRRRFCRSPSIATASSSTRLSAPGTPGSSSPIAGTATSHRDPVQRQVCWSHIQRDFRRHSEGLGEQKIFGEQGFELTRRVFAAWRAYQHEHHDRDRLAAEIAPIQTELRRAARRRQPEEQAHPLASSVREQPAQGLARALDVRHPHGRRADQQSRRARAPRTSHPSKAFARHPKRERRAIR